MRRPTVLAYISFLGGFFMGELTNYLRYWSEKHKFNLIIVRTNGFAEFETPVALDHCDAVICILTAVKPSWLNDLAQKKPVIVVGSDDYDYDAVDVIFSDNRQGTDDIMDHLHQLGYRMMGYVGDYSIPDFRVRHDAYKNKLEEFGIPYNEDFVFWVSEPSLQGGREAGAKLIESGQKISAMICGADLIALGLLQTLEGHNIYCPKDIAVVGYEATTLGWQFSPKLTSVNQRMFYVMETAFQRVQARLNGEPKFDKSIFVPQQLFIGESCGSPPESQLGDDEFHRIKSQTSGIDSTGEQQLGNNESIIAFAKAGFESIISISYLFGPFISEGFRAYWEDDGENLRINDQFNAAGHVKNFEQVQLPCESYPTLPENLYLLTLIPIHAADNPWEIIAIFDDHRHPVDYNMLALYHNYLDMIAFALERDALATISKKREEESLHLTKQLINLNNTLELRVEERTQQLAQINNKLTKTNEELVKTSEYKSNFISNMSHELRTPLNSVVGFTKRLLRAHQGSDDTKLLNALNAIDRNGQRLVQLVNDVLDISKVEEGFVELEMVKTNLADMLCNAIEELSPLAEDKKLPITFEPDSTIEAVFDEKRITQVATNLLSNAIKYTEHGHIRVNIGTINTPKRSIFFSVSDTGAGIAQEDFEKLFDKFGRLKKHEKSDIEGTGLGLTIANEIVKLHKGQIEVQSEVGKGSCFTVKLPA